MGERAVEVDGHWLERMQDLYILLATSTVGRECEQLFHRHRNVDPTRAYPPSCSCGAPLMPVQTAGDPHIVSL